MTADDLELARRVDWRFLLPDAALGRVACPGRVPEGLHRALARFSGELAEGPAAAGEYDLVVVTDGSRRDLERAALLVRPGGWVYVETSGPARRRVESVLRRQGFEGITARWHWPSFDRCLEIVPIDEPDAIRAALARRRAGVRSRLKATGAGLLAALAQLDRAVPCVSVLGRRPDGSGRAVSFATSLIEALGSSSAELAREMSDLLVTPRFPTSRHVIALVVPTGDSAPAFVAKMPRLVADRTGVDREATVLRRFDEVSGGHGGAPRVVSLDDACGWPALVETAIRGLPLNPRAVRRDPARCIGAVRGWLDRLPAAPARSDTVERLLAGPLSSLGPSWAADVGRSLELLAPLAAADVPLVFEHCDLSHPNLILQADGTLGVVDWELAEPDGLPLGDLCFFLAYVAASRDGAETPETQSASFVRAFVGADAWAGGIVLDEAGRRRVPAQLIEPLFVATWARDAARFAVRAGAQVNDVATARPYRYWRLALEHAGSLGWI